jgi:hypothetical protein
MRLAVLPWFVLWTSIAEAGPCPARTEDVRAWLDRPDLLAFDLHGAARQESGQWVQDVAILRDAGHAMARRVLGRLHFVASGRDCILLRLERRGERLVHRDLPEPKVDALAAIAARSIPTLLGDDADHVGASRRVGVANDPVGRWIDERHYRLRLHLDYSLRLTPCRTAELSRVAHDALFRRDDVHGWRLIAARRIDSRDPWTDFPISMRSDAACPSAASATH